MKELLELKERTEKEINDMYNVMQNKEVDKIFYRRYLDKIDFLKLINIVYSIK